MGYSPWGHRESDSTERLSTAHPEKELAVSPWAATPAISDPPWAHSPCKKWPTGSASWQCPVSSTREILTELA